MQSVEHNNMRKLTMPTDRVATTIRENRPTARTRLPFGRTPRKAAPYLPLDTRLKLYHAIKGA